MKLFVNDILIDVQRQPNNVPLADYTKQLTSLAQITAENLKGHVLILNAEPASLAAIMRLMELRRVSKLLRITMVPQDYKAIREWVKTEYKVVKAGGGLVLKKGKVLMIYRLGRWDLPKGKLEKEETPVQGALREVAEECNVKVTADEKLCSTWHTYTDGGRRSIKKTTWFIMQCHDDALMKPQHEEGIEDLRWMNPAELDKAIQNSYASIKHVVATYRDLIATAV